MRHAGGRGHRGARPAYPELAFEWLGLEGFVLGTYLAWLWRKPRLQRPSQQRIPESSAEA